MIQPNPETASGKVCNERARLLFKKTTDKVLELYASSAPHHPMPDVLEAYAAIMEACGNDMDNEAPQQQ